jgi:hypothetical protein
MSPSGRRFGCLGSSCCVDEVGKSSYELTAWRDPGKPYEKSSWVAFPQRRLRVRPIMRRMSQQNTKTRIEQYRRASTRKEHQSLNLNGLTVMRDIESFVSGGRTLKCS